MRNIVTNLVLSIPDVQFSIKSQTDYKIYDSGKRHTFFGYFDKNPINNENTKILACALDCDNSPRRSLPITTNMDIGYFGIDSPNEFIKINSTQSWCWQQGARLMWVPKKENSLIFNSYDGNNYVSIEQNIITGEKIVHQFPIYDLSSNGYSTLSLDFEHLGHMRPGYGYINSDHTVSSDISNNGIWLGNLATGDNNLIITYADLINKSLQLTKIGSGDEFYVNHLSFNPTGNRFIFFFIVNNNGKRKVIAYSSDTSGNDLFLLNGGRKISHFSWIDDNNLIVTSEGDDGRFGYHTIEDKTDNINYIDIEQYTHIDGHPSKLFDGFLSDTYPLGILRKQYLFIYTNALKEILDVISPPYFNGEVRCDLHPRISADGNFVTVDVPLKTGRKMLVAKIPTSKY